MRGTNPLRLQDLIEGAEQLLRASVEPDQKDWQTFDANRTPSGGGGGGGGSLGTAAPTPGAPAVITNIPHYHAITNPSVYQAHASTANQAHFTAVAAYSQSPSPKNSRRVVQAGLVARGHSLRSASRVASRHTGAPPAHLLKTGPRKVSGTGSLSHQHSVAKADAAAAAALHGAAAAAAFAHSHPGTSVSFYHASARAAANAAAAAEARAAAIHADALAAAAQRARGGGSAGRVAAPRTGTGRGGRGGRGHAGGGRGGASDMAAALAANPNYQVNAPHNFRSLNDYEDQLAQRYLQDQKGSATSGNYGHAGRPGEVGGSGPGGWSMENGVSGDAVRPGGKLDTAYNTKLYATALKEADYMSPPVKFPGVTQDVRDRANEQLPDRLKLTRAGIERWNSEAWVQGTDDGVAGPSRQTIALQMAVSEKFGMLPQFIDGADALPSAYGMDGPVVGRMPWDDVKEVARAIVDASYADVQARFAAAGITEVVLTRGMSNADPFPTDKPEFNVKLGFKPASSWTSDPKWAQAFASDYWANDHRFGYVLTATVPVGNILGDGLHGTLGGPGMSEHVVIGERLRVHAEAFAKPAAQGKSAADPDVEVDSEDLNRRWLNHVVKGEARLLPATAGKGSSTSGNYGHAGRPGQRGGSGPGSPDWQAVPKAPGETTIPDGMVRLYHYTNDGPEALASIAQHGILKSRARGESYGEPSVIWASGQEPGNFKHFVEFYADPKKDLDINQFQEGYRNADGTPFTLHDWVEGHRDVTMRGDVPADHILAVHEPWHHTFRYMEADAEHFKQDMVETPGFYSKEAWPEGSNEQRAFAAFKSKHGLKSALDVEAKGGPGSGNHGHAGRPGEVGGSAVSREEFEKNAYWHGSVNGEIGFIVPKRGIHIGTFKAAKQALEAQIGKRADGGEWDGTREYGKTLLASARGGTGYNADGPDEPHLPSGRLTYENGAEVPLNVRPNIQAVKIRGAMTNNPSNPYGDWHANGYMAAQLSRGRARSGYFYRNVSEDEGSVSAVVPSRSHLQTYGDHTASGELGFGPKDAFFVNSPSPTEDPYYRQQKGGPGSGNHGHAGRPGEVGGSGSGDGHAVTEFAADLHKPDTEPKTKDIAAEVIRQAYEDPAVRAVASALKDRGDLQVVGGAVRDVAMGKPPKDFDLRIHGVAADALQNHLEAIPGAEVNLTGDHFPVYRIKAGGSEVEVAMPRTEDPANDQHYLSDHTITPEADSQRRDFTANAIGVSLSTGKISDPTGGLKDIANNELRTVTPESFVGDPNRMLRAMVRIADGVNPSPEMLQQIKDNVGRMDSVPAERVAGDFAKAMGNKDPVKALDVMEKTGLLDKVIPELRQTVGFDQQNKWHDQTLFDHLKGVVGRVAELNPDPDVRIAALLHDIGKPATMTVDDKGQGHFYGHEHVGAGTAREILGRLRFSNDRIDRISHLIDSHMFSGRDWTMRSATRFSSRMNEGLDGMPPADREVVHQQRIRDLMDLREADQYNHASPNDGNVGHMKDLLRQVGEQNIPTSRYQLAINGSDLISMGMEPGPHFRDVLNHLQEQVQSGAVANDAEALRNAARLFKSAEMEVKGGTGSGNYGHEGRPGQVGGSHGMHGDRWTGAAPGGHPNEGQGFHMEGHEFAETELPAKVVRKIKANLAAFEASGARVTTRHGLLSHPDQKELMAQARKTLQRTGAKGAAGFQMMEAAINAANSNSKTSEHGDLYIATRDNGKAAQLLGVLYIRPLTDYHYRGDTLVNIPPTARYIDYIGTSQEVRGTGSVLLQQAARDHAALFNGDMVRSAGSYFRGVGFEQQELSPTGAGYQDTVPMTMWDEGVRMLAGLKPAGQKAVGKDEGEDGDYDWDSDRNANPSGEQSGSTDLEGPADSADSKGGPGSGDHGHAGRPGEVGGSGSGVSLAPVELLPDQGPIAKAVREYQGAGSDAMNMYLRDGFTSSVAQGRQVAMQTTAIMNAMQPLPTDTTLYRAIGFGGLDIILGREDSDTLSSDDLRSALAAKKGTVIEDKGFTSTTRDKAVAGAKVYHGTVVVQIDAPAGTRAVDITNRPGLGDPDFDFEKEVLLDHSANYRILGVSDKTDPSFETEYPVHVLHMELLT